jgi:hypothetical protein
MARYAIVRDGMTENIIILEDEAKYNPPEGTELVPEDKAPPMKSGTNGPDSEI